MIDSKLYLCDTYFREMKYTRNIFL